MKQFHAHARGSHRSATLESRVGARRRTLADFDAYVMQYGYALSHSIGVTMQTEGVGFEPTGRTIRYLVKFVTQLCVLTSEHPKSNRHSKHLPISMRAQRQKANADLATAREHGKREESELTEAVLQREEL